MQNRKKNHVQEAEPAVIYNVETGRMIIIDSHVASRGDYIKSDKQDNDLVRELAGIRVV